jgi:predicted dehydrogenase
MKQTRRSFLKITGSTVAGLPFLKTTAKAQAGDKILRHASIGAGGQAGADIGAFSSHPAFRLAAVADVDSSRLDGIKKRSPETRVYQDWRELFEKEKDNIDSVNVSTPDHMHAKVAAAFMEAGKHAYVQKPLAQTVAETQHLANLAEKHKLVTQMGTQLASTPGNIRVVELVHSGAIGKLKSAYLWSGKTWGDPNPIPEGEDPLPAGFDWKLWLGVATDRPYKNGIYHPGNWRKRLDFGTGTLGDMGCHIFHPVFAALKIGAPLSIESRGPKPNKDNWSIDASLHYIFPGNELTESDTIDFHWYDGAARPPAEIIDMLGATIKARVPDQGSIIVGTKGLLLCPHGGLPYLAPFETLGKTEHPKQNPRDHYHEYIEACLGNEAVLRSRFDYAAKLTESVLLGCLATHFPNEKLDWDTKALGFTNKKEANPLVTRIYRDDWTIPGLPTPAAS